MDSSLSTRHSSLATVVSGAAADYTLFLAVLAVLAASLAPAREVNYGPGLQTDSTEYLHAAQNLPAGGGFIVYRGGGYTIWPPLYPLALAAAAGLSGFAPLDVAGPLNAAFFGLTVFAAGRWLRRRLESRFLAAWAAAALALAVPLVDAASWVMSEPLFILVTTLALIHSDNFLTAGKTRSLAAAAAYGALAWQARYIGAAVPFFVGLLLLCHARRGDWPRRVKQAAVVWLAAGLPMSLWMLRNFLSVGFFSGPRWEYDYPLPEVLRDIGATLWRWLYFELPAIGMQPPEMLSLPPRPRYEFLKQSMGSLQPPELFSLAGGVWAAAAAAAAVYVLLRFPWKKQTLAAWRPFCISAGFALTYLALFSAAAVLEYSDDVLRPRYAAPVYIPLLTAAAFTLDRLGRAGRGSRGSASRLPAAAVAAALCLWTAGQAAPHARRTVRANAGLQDGDVHPGFPACVVASETLCYIRENPLDGTVYANNNLLLLPLYNSGGAAYRGLLTAADYELLYVSYGGALEYQQRTARRAAARRKLLNPRFAAAGQERLEARLAAAPDGAWLVWFQDAAWQDGLLGYGRAYLSVSPRLETVAELADGGVYKVRQDAPPRKNPYRAALEAAAPPVESGEWRVESGTPSLAGGDLVYLKQSCSAEEVRARFFLHVYPADRADLPFARKRYGFNNLNFHFSEYGVFLEGACVALYPLPDYAIERIETGQVASAQGAAWKTALRPVRRP